MATELTVLSVLMESVKLYNKSVSIFLSVFVFTVVHLSFLSLVTISSCDIEHREQRNKSAGKEDCYEVRVSILSQKYSSFVVLLSINCFLVDLILSMIRAGCIV